MAIEVELPDGSVAEFPDGTPNEVIEEALRSHLSGAAVQDAQPAAQPQNAAGPPTGAGGAGVLGFSQGATGGFGDELYGAMSKFLPSWLTPHSARLSPAADARAAEAGLPTNYEVGRDFAREINTGAREESPWAYLGGELVGGLGATAPIGGAGSMARLAGTGAGLGGVYGAGYSEAPGAGGVALDTALGAGIGGVAAPVVGAVAGAGLRGIKRGAQALHERFTATPRREATAALRQALSEDAITPAVGQRVMEQTGGQGRVLDLGPNLTGLGEAIAQRPGAGQRIITDALKQRQAGQQGRMIDLIEDTVQPDGWNWDYRQLMTNLADQRGKQAGPLYDAAYQNTIRSTPKLERLIGGIDDPSFKHPMRPAWDKAMQQFRMEGGEGGTVRFMDLFSRKLRDMANKAARDGEKDTARVLGNWRRELDREIYKQAPELKQARNVFAGAKQLEDAADAGREILQKQATTADDVMDATAKFTDSQWDAFRIGVVRGMVDRVKRAADTHDAANKLGRSTRVKEILDVIFPDDQAAEKFFSRMTGEQTMTFNNARIMGNSRTFARQMQRERLDQNPLVNAGVDLMSGDKIGAAVNTMRAMAGKSEISDEALEELAKMLLAKPDAGHLSQILRGTEAPGQLAREARAARELRNRLTGAVMPALVGGQVGP